MTAAEKWGAYLPVSLKELASLIGVGCQVIWRWSKSVGFPLVLFVSTVNALERARGVQRKHGKHPSELEVTE